MGGVVTHHSSPRPPGSRSRPRRCSAAAEEGTRSGCHKGRSPVDTGHAPLTRWRPPAQLRGETQTHTHTHTKQLTLAFLSPRRVALPEKLVRNIKPLFFSHNHKGHNTRARKKKPDQGLLLFQSLEERSLLPKEDEKTSQWPVALLWWQMDLLFWILLFWIVHRISSNIALPRMQYWFFNAQD